MWGELRKLHKYSAGERSSGSRSLAKGARSAGASESKTFGQFKSVIMYLFRFWARKYDFSLTPTPRC